MRALLSVSDKTGLAEFAHGLAALGIELIATGGTARTLQEAGLTVTPVERVTGFPELLGGRVKTLHPAIHAGILAPRDPTSLNEIAAHGIAPIDLVVVNLYPFEATVAQPDVRLEDAVEQIDIGGVALLRAAAKNFDHVTTVVDPADYATVLDELRNAGNTSPETRARLAVKAFRHTAGYDAAIASYLAEVAVKDGDPLPDHLPLVLHKTQDLRYGENPHQRGALYRLPRLRGLADAEQLHGKELSFTNVLDIDAAWALAHEFDAPAVAIIKHASPCGCAVGEPLVEAYRAALASDPVSAFGGIVGTNRPVDEATARAITEIFTEAVIAPDFTDAALAVLTQKKNLRLIRAPFAPPATLDLRLLHGSAVAQEPDTVDYEGELQTVTERAPTEEELQALRFAWKVCRHVKSNAIVFARGTATVGIGTGQPSRVDSVKLAAMKAGERAQGAVMASDAFFPFPDGIEEAAKAGVTAVIQPGGSVRDAEVIAAANAHGMAMVFTGMRHFRH